MNEYKKKQDSTPIPGAADIRFSSYMQSDSFCLDAQLRQIKEQAERDGVEIVHELQSLDTNFKAVQQPNEHRSHAIPQPRYTTSVWWLTTDR